MGIINVLRTIKSSVNSRKRRVVQVNRYGKDDVVEFLDGSTFGIDSQSPKNTPQLSIMTERGTYVIGSISGFKKAKDGEIYFFSTDKDGKAQKSNLKLKNDGTVEIMGADYTAVRYEKLENAFNKLKSDFNSLVQKYNAHVHPGVTPGNASTSATPSVGTTSSADISSAQSKNIKIE